MNKIHRATTQLRSFIGLYESNNNYDVVWGGIQYNDIPVARVGKKLTQMTIQEVLDWQDSIDHKYMSEAAGRYQIMEDTLREIYYRAGFKPHDLFDDITQDYLAIYLLNRRGMERYFNGEITTEKFCNNVAKEWASMPLVSGDRKGYSYYAGDGLNKAHADPDEFMKVARAAKEFYNGVENEIDWESQYRALIGELEDVLNAYSKDL